MENFPFDLNDPPPLAPPRLIRTSAVRMPQQPMPQQPRTVVECNQVIAEFWMWIYHILQSHGYEGDRFVRLANAYELEEAMVEVRKLQVRMETDTLDALIGMARKLGAEFINRLLVRYHMVR